MRASRIKRIRERLDDPNIEYTDNKKGDKVTAKLKSTTSAEYTNLSKMIEEFNQKKKELEELENKLKEIAREEIQALFDVDDEVKTRIVDTVSFMIQLTKVPEPSAVTKYATVVKELREHLAPEALHMLDDLIEKNTKYVQKAPALTIKAKESRNLNEGIFDKAKEFFKKFADYVKGWCRSYDDRLEALKAEVGM